MAGSTYFLANITEHRDFFQILLFRSHQPAGYLAAIHSPEV